MLGIPKIRDVKPLDNMLLFVTFDNDVKKQYDVKPLLEKFTVFSELKNLMIFNLVHVDTGGYGIIWNDEIDLSGTELWENGQPVE